MTGDTIAAVATPPGKGGVGVVRVSGPLATDICKTITNRDVLKRKATYCDFFDSLDQIIDQGIVLRFVAPASFTGEDVVEFQGHGGPIVLSLLLNRILELGARIARPGEFSERAFLNDKMDLAQAEAVADLIESSTETAARGALRSLQGEFSTQVKLLDANIVQLRMFVEAAIDFPEEEIDFLSDERLLNLLESAQTKMDLLRQQTKEGAILREGLSVVMIGEPNAGKSSLMNRFVGDDVSIVTDVPGTTRDLVKESISLFGIPLKLTDTAGIRESGNVVEQEGVKRARAEVAKADAVLLVVDVSRAMPWNDQLRELVEGFELPNHVFVVLNKIDLHDVDIGEATSYLTSKVSAMTGDGIEALKTSMKEALAPNLSPESGFIARSRHVNALAKAERHLTQGRVLLLEQAAGELFAEELRLCHDALIEITGEYSSDDLLGEIFSSFCIGK